MKHDLRPLRPFRSMATPLDERKTLEGKRILARRKLKTRGWSEASSASAVAHLPTCKPCQATESGR